jgi:hypothetical protein
MFYHAFSVTCNSNSLVRILDRPSLGFFPISFKIKSISPKLNVEDLYEVRRIHIQWRGLNKKEEDLNEMGRFETQ